MQYHAPYTKEVFPVLDFSHTSAKGMESWEPVSYTHLAKTAEVDIFEIRIARGMCGKSYVLLTGSVAAVTEAVESSVSMIKEEGLVLDYAVIPSPSKEFVRTLI